MSENNRYAFAEGVVQASGRQMEKLAGEAVTRLLEDLDPDDTEAGVETCLGFSDAGQFWADGILFTYTGVTHAPNNNALSYFTGVTTELPRVASIGSFTEVHRFTLNELPDHGMEVL